MNALLRCPATVTDSSNSDIYITCPSSRRARSTPPRRYAGALAVVDAASRRHPGRCEADHPLFRQRGTIEQLFRVMKSKGFDIEAVHVADNGPFENFTTATLI